MSDLRTVVAFFSGIRIHKEGFLIIGASIVVDWLLFIVSNTCGIIGIIIILFCTYFFRDPQRIPPITHNVVVSAADGIVDSITTGVSMPDDLLKNLLKNNDNTCRANVRDGDINFDDASDDALCNNALDCNKWNRISVFLSIFDVHVNRIPINGEVVATHYHKGLFLNASLDKSSEKNERRSMLIKYKCCNKVCKKNSNDNNLDDENNAAKNDIVNSIVNNDMFIGVVQIAGLIGRRIVCNAKIGDSVCIGEKFGIIKFGSRVDVYLPMSMQVLVLKGQRMIGGETVIAKFNEKIN